MFSFIPAWIFGGVVLAVGGAALLLKRFIGTKSPWTVALSAVLDTLAKDVQSVDKIDQEVASQLASRGVPLAIANYIGRIVEDAVRTVIQMNKEYDPALVAGEVAVRITDADVSIVQQSLTTIPITSGKEAAYALAKITMDGFGPAKLEQMARSVTEAK